jgi:hypothetical protein
MGMWNVFVGNVTLRVLWWWRLRVSLWWLWSVVGMGRRHVGVAVREMRGRMLLCLGWHCVL